MLNLFSKLTKNLKSRTIFTYLSVVIIPLVILVVVIQIIVTRFFLNNLKILSETNLNKNAQVIYENLQSVELIKKIICSNTDLLMMMVFPDEKEQQQLIQDLVRQSLTLERISSVEQNIFGIRIFAENKKLPERFPIVFQESRLKADVKEGWQYNYKIDYLDDAISRLENLASYTSEIIYGKKHLGYLSVEIEMKKMFPFLYKEFLDSSFNYTDYSDLNYNGDGYKSGQNSEQKNLINDYVFFISENQTGSIENHSYVSNLNAASNVNSILSKNLTANINARENLNLASNLNASAHAKNETFANSVITKRTNKISTKILTPLVNQEIINFSSEPSENFVKKINKIINKNPQAKSFTFKIRDRKNSFLVSATKIPELNILIVNSCSTKLISNSLFALTATCVIGICILSFILLLVVNFTTKNLLSGVYSIIDGMKNVRGGNLDVKIQEIGNDEITQTQRTFNQMTVQLKNQITQIKKDQELITETEMKAMLNQINAHFLYNVLETIRMQALINNDEETSESISMLGKMLHYCLQWRSLEVRLEQELEYINSYIYILNIRNDYLIDLEIDIDESYKKLEIPKMILQPLIENAFFYAIEPVAKNSKIKIYTEKDKFKDLIWICVQDFGSGMSYEKIAEIQNYLDDKIPEKKSSGGSIGLKNIQMRLTMIYGKDCRLQIISKENSGTLVRIPIPFVP